MDDMKMRKLDIAHYEIRRKPWNPTQKDYEQMEERNRKRMIVPEKEDKTYFYLQKMRRGNAEDKQRDKIS